MADYGYAQELGLLWDRPSCLLMGRRIHFAFREVIPATAGRFPHSADFSFAGLDLPSSINRQGGRLIPCTRYFHFLD